VEKAVARGSVSTPRIRGGIKRKIVSLLKKFKKWEKSREESLEIHLTFKIQNPCTILLCEGYNEGDSERHHPDTKLLELGGKRSRGFHNEEGKLKSHKNPKECQVREKRRKCHKAQG